MHKTNDARIEGIGIEDIDRRADEIMGLHRTERQSVKHLKKGEIETVPIIILQGDPRDIYARIDERKKRNY